MCVSEALRQNRSGSGIAAVSGLRNFYAAGTASNHFVGDALIGTTTSGVSKLVVNDDSVQVTSPTPPASATDTGETGRIAWDNEHIYVCTVSDTWKRSALAPW